MQKKIRFNKNGVSPVIFAPVSAKTLNKLRESADTIPYRHSSFSPSQIYMWKSVFQPTVAFVAGCAVFRFTERQSKMMSTFSLVCSGNSSMSI